MLQGSASTLIPPPLDLIPQPDGTGLINATVQNITSEISDSLTDKQIFSAKNNMTDTETSDERGERVQGEPAGLGPWLG